MLEKSKNKQLLVIVSVVLIIGILAIVIFLPAENKYGSGKQPRLIASAFQSTLTDLYLSCKIYWAERNESEVCNIETAKKVGYKDFKYWGKFMSDNFNNDDFEIKVIASGSATNFKASASISPCPFSKCTNEIYICQLDSGGNISC
jgi:hypothetical protein